MRSGVAAAFGNSAGDAKLIAKNALQLILGKGRLEMMKSDGLAKVRI
jgi:septum formation topological specificity factor MinE